MGTPPPPQYNLPIATATTLGGVKSTNVRNGVYIDSFGNMYQNSNINTSINSRLVYLDMDGNDSTADGTGSKPFATLLAAVNYLNTHLVDRNITFYLNKQNQQFIINDKIAFNDLNICFSSHPSGAHYVLNNILYFNNCNLVFEGCTMNFVANNKYMVLIGNTNVTLGTYYTSSFTNNLTDGTVCNCFVTYGSDFNASFIFAPFIAITMINFILGANLRLLNSPTYVNIGMLMLKVNYGVSINSSSFIYNSNVLDAAHRFNSTNVYIY